METKGSQPPSLLIAYGSYHDKKHSLYKVLENRCDTLEIELLSDKNVLSCNFGWLTLMNRLTQSCSLWNPESRRMIHLPELPTEYNKCVLSKPPTEPDCHILFKSANKCKIAFCHIGDDEFVEMSIKENEDVERVQALEFFRGEIYALVGFTPRLMKILFNGKTIEFKLILKSKYIFLPIRPWSIVPKYYLIDYNGEEMLLVCKMSPDFNLDQYSDFKIFRIYVDSSEWVELEDIGQRTIFLSNNGDAFCSSSSSPGTKPNCIYYTDAGRILHIYNLQKRGTINLLPCPAADRLSITRWIEHSF